MLWLLAGLCLGIFSRSYRVRNRALLYTLILLILFSNPFLLNRFSRLWDVDTGNINSQKVYSCTIVLGGFSSSDGDGRGYFNAHADRFIQGLKLKMTGKVSHLLITGGNSDIIPGKFRESVWVKEELKLMQVPDSSILIESESRNTLENALFVTQELKRRGLAPPYLLVTSAFHMRRALYTFRRAGVQVIPYSSTYIAGRKKVSVDEFIPQVEILSKWGIYIKELIGFGIYYVKG
ncbi:YdcF family protein [Flavihumibacter sp. R14]|nr:YdcF family protein [Flavihumibacter soli]